ncbi:MAG: signal peptidase I [Polyangiaceae bacterium]
MKRYLPAAVQVLVRGLGLYVIPALMAGLALKFLVPAAGTGYAGWVARMGHLYPLESGAMLFLGFSALAHYWRFHIPGGRHVSALPPHWAPHERAPERLRAWAELAETYDVLWSPGTRKRLERTLNSDALGAFDRHLSTLASAIESADVDAARVAARGAGELAAPVRPALAWRQALRAAIALGGAVALALALRARVAGSYQVLSGSMLPTLEPADRIVANKLAYVSAGRIPARGDVIVFRSAAVALGDAPSVPDVLVKRVVGLPGDRIEMDGESPVINGWQVPSCDAGQYLYVVPEGDGATLQGRVRVEFLGDRAYLTVRVLGRPILRDAYVVGPGEVFVLGDNRSNSLDSRSWNGGHGGGVPLTALEGRAQWFLIGTHRSGEADLGRFLRPIDSMQGRLRMEGVDATVLESGIAGCVHDRPKDTRPPPPGGPPTASASGT